MYLYDSTTRIDIAKIRTTSDSNSDTTGALASALIASATTRVRRLHDMTQSDMQAIRSCMYSYMNACMYVHLQHHAYEDHGSYKQAVFIQVSTSGRRGHALRPRNTVLLRRFLTSTSTGSTPTTSTRALDFVKLRHDSTRCKLRPLHDQRIPTMPCSPMTPRTRPSHLVSHVEPSGPIEQAVRAHVDHGPRQPRPERLHRAHVDHGPSGSAELRPRRP